MKRYTRAQLRKMPFAEAKARMIIAYWKDRRPRNYERVRGRNYYGDMAELELLYATNPGLREKITS